LKFSSELIGYRGHSAFFFFRIFQVGNAVFFVGFYFCFYRWCQRTSWVQLIRTTEVPAFSLPMSTAQYQAHKTRFNSRNCLQVLNRAWNFFVRRI